MPQLEKLSFALGAYEPHVVESMTRHIKPGSVAYDLGANAGYLTLIMSTMAENSGQVVAFEPNTTNFDALNANLEDNGIKNVITNNRAISDTTGELTFASFDYSLVGHIATDETPDDARLSVVQAVSLDDLIFNEGFPKPDFIKIDVEGAEEKVIHGADRVLREHRPIILAEIREQDVYQSVVDYLKTKDYRCEALQWRVLDDTPLGEMLFMPT